MVCGFGHGALGFARLDQGQAREAGTEKSDVSGANLSRAASSIAYALARTSPRKGWRAPKARPGCPAKPHRRPVVGLGLLFGRRLLRVSEEPT